MEYLIIAVAAIMVIVSVIACVAYYRGRLNLSPAPESEKVQFILMHKPRDGREDPRNVAMNPAVAAQKDIAPSGSSNAQPSPDSERTPGTN